MIGDTMATIDGVLCNRLLERHFPMEYSATAKATEYLANFPNAVLPNDQFEMVECRSRGVPVVTSYELYTTKNLTLRLKPINSLTQRGLILRFYDYLSPRPFSQLEALEATFLAP